MVEFARVVAVVPLGGRRIRVTFSDDLVRELDFAGALTGVLSAIDDDVAFAGAVVDGVAGTVCWPGGLDLDPDVLHGGAEAASGPRPVVIREYRLQQAG